MTRPSVEDHVNLDLSNRYRLFETGTYASSKSPVVEILFVGCSLCIMYMNHKLLSACAGVPSILTFGGKDGTETLRGPY